MTIAPMIWQHSPSGCLTVFTPFSKWRREWHQPRRRLLAAQPARYQSGTHARNAAPNRRLWPPREPADHSANVVTGSTGSVNVPSSKAWMLKLVGGLSRHFQSADAASNSAPIEHLSIRQTLVPHAVRNIIPCCTRVSASTRLVMFCSVIDLSVKFSW